MNRYNEPQHYCRTVKRNRSFERYGKGASVARNASYNELDVDSERAAKVKFRVPIPAILHLKLPGFLLSKIDEPQQSLNQNTGIFAVKGR